MGRRRFAESPPPGRRRLTEGRYCATCHNGVTRLSAVGALQGRDDLPIFAAAATADRNGCLRCHAPADHGADFTARHGDIVERGGTSACRPCHAQRWTEAERRLQADLLAAERALAVNPDDPNAALAIGPNNFCVYCHRRDSEWRERD